MKKIVCLTLALLLCLSAVALAEEVVPSKNTSDMVVVEVDPALNTNVPADSGFVVIPVLEEDEAQAVEYADNIALCREEIVKLMESAAGGTDASGVEAYFGEVRDSEGNVVVLSEALSAPALNVFEFMPLVAANYDEAYGNVTLTFQFKTPYAQDEPVLVLIGLRNAETGEMEWTVFEGIGVGEEGAVQVEFTPEILKAIQEDNALLAVVSAAEAEAQ
mgnify:FL=1